MEDGVQSLFSKNEYFELLEKSIICYEKTKDLEAGKDVGIAYYYLEEYDIAIGKFEDLIRLINDKTDLYYEILLYIATSYGKMGYNEKALVFYRKLAESTRLQNKYNGHMGMGIVLTRIGKFSENASLFDLALQEFESALGFCSNQKKIAAVHSNMAEVYQAIEKHEIAISLYKKALLVHKEGHWRADTLNSLALSLAYLKHFEEALECVDEAYAISMSRNYQTSLANNFYVQGIIHKLKDQCDRAYIFLNQAKNLSNEMGILQEYAEICYILSELEKDKVKSAYYKAEHDLILKQLGGGA